MTPWTAAYQAPPSMGFSRQEYWRGVPLPSLQKMLTPMKEGQIEDSMSKHTAGLSRGQWGSGVELSPRALLYQLALAHSTPSYNFVTESSNWVFSPQFRWSVYAGHRWAVPLVFAWLSARGALLSVSLSLHVSFISFYHVLKSRRS